MAITATPGYATSGREYDQPYFANNPEKAEEA